MRRAELGLRAIQHEADVRAGADQVQRFLDRALAGRSGIDDEHDLTDMQRQSGGLAGRQDRRGVQDNDSIGVAMGDLLEEVGRRGTGQKLRA